MEQVILQNAGLNGEVTLPPSKSAAHRALICAFLAGGGTVEPLSDSEDIAATQAALAALRNGETEIDCNESGSTLRFLIPVAAALGKSVTFTGKGRLCERPIGEYLRLLPENGVTCQSEGGLPLSVSGQLTAGRYEIAGDISSQYITGLLLALPLLDGDSEIVLTTPLQSEPYVAMTLQVQRAYGIEIKQENNRYYIKGHQSYQKRAYTVEADWSQAAFFLVGGALTGMVTLKGLLPDSCQGDKQITDILRRFGAAVTVDENGVTVKRSALHGIHINVCDIPDMVPSLAVAAAFAEGTTVITGGERLRLKESDRIESVVSNLRKMGVAAEETADGMVIHGGKVHGAALSGYHDHRIVMAFSIAALCAEGETVISDALSIRKSYPSFFEDYNALGGKANVIHNR